LWGIAVLAKKFSIQYRQLKLDEIDLKGDLKSSIVQSMERNVEGKCVGEHAKLRIIDLDQDKSFVILNKITTKAFWQRPEFGGQIIHLQDGQEVHAVSQSLDEDASEFLVESLDLGASTRVMRGALYFVIVGNHVGIIEGTQVRGRTLERYLTNLLQQSGKLSPGQTVILNARFEASGGKKLDKSEKITLTAQRSAKREDLTRDVITDTQAATAAAHAGKTVFDVLRVLGWDEGAIASLDHDIPKGGWLEGLFSVRIKAKNKRTSSISRATVDEALRNIDADDLGLKGEGSEKGGIVKLTSQREIKMVGGLLDPQDAITQILEALKEWSKSGKIDCTFETET
jgi:hypothetical protein